MGICFYICGGKQWKIFKLRGKKFLNFSNHINKTNCKNGNCVNSNKGNWVFISNNGNKGCP